MYDAIFKPCCTQENKAENEAENEAENKAGTEEI